MEIIYFFIGTEAELMKMFRVIKEARNRGYVCKIISNGQNMIHNSFFLPLCDSKVDIDLTKYADKTKDAGGYLKWYLRTEKIGVRILKEELKKNLRAKKILVVHGDTLSTLMGARIARKCKLQYVHVESGLRSFNWFSPFPEEFDRFFSSLHSVINFCPKQNYTDYAAKRFKGKAVNTMYNTGIETLYYALEQIKEKKMSAISDQKYFVLAMHRQENLLNRKFMNNVIEAACEMAEKMSCVFIYHVQTQEMLKKYELWEKIENNPHIMVVGRQGYCEFINTIIHSEFIMADGCGNQQEMYYLGKPYLIMRTKIESSSEGLGWNAKMFNGSFEDAKKFTEGYTAYIHDPIKPERLPSNIIMDEIDSYFTKAVSAND